MNDKLTLGRWADVDSDAPEELRRLLDVGRSELGSVDEVAKLAASLSRTLGPAAGLSDVAGSGRLESSDVAPTASGAAANGAAASGAAASGETSALKPWLLGGVIAGGVLLGVAAWNAGAGSPASEPEPKPALQARPEAPPVVLVPPLVLDRALPAGPVEEARAPAVRARSTKPNVRGEDEAALLRRAQASLADAPARALELTEQHRRRFPRGTLAEEREVLAIEALKRLGRGRAAGDKASEFDRNYGGSVHHRRVRGEATASPVEKTSK
jgi:hypothetical protein